MPIKGNSDYYNEFKKQNYKRITILCPIEKAGELYMYAEKNEISLSKLFCDAVSEYTGIDLRTKTEK